MLPPPSIAAHCGNWDGWKQPETETWINPIYKAGGGSKDACSWQSCGGLRQRTGRRCTYCRDMEPCTADDGPVKTVLHHSWTSWTNFITHFTHEMFAISPMFTPPRKNARQKEVEEKFIFLQTFVYKLKTSIKLTKSWVKSQLNFRSQNAENMKLFYIDYIVEVEVRGQTNNWLVNYCHRNTKRPKSGPKPQKWMCVVEWSFEQTQCPHGRFLLDIWSLITTLNIEFNNICRWYKK